MKKDISLNILPLDSRLRDVLETLNNGIFGIVFIQDKNQRIVGVFTDGDIRRSLLKGSSLDSPVKDNMVTDFVFAREDLSEEERIKLLSEKIRHLPILDSEDRLTDFMSWAEMWRIPVMEPTLGGNELKYVTDCITTNWISSQGRYVKSFEKEFANYHNVKYALATSSGTTALHLALKALGIGPGDEVIVPDLTFAASANTVIHSGAEPVFVDISEGHWTLNPDYLKSVTTPKTKAIMPVHLYGHPCDMDPIVDFAKRHQLHIIEDCAEALGAMYKDTLVGKIGDIGCFSFFSNKVITTGEGGMVITDDKDLYHKMMILRDHGMSKNKHYWHEMAGFNYRMTNLQAALGVAQLEQIDIFLKTRHFIALEYERHLKNVEGLSLPIQMDWAKSIFWLYTIMIDDNVIPISRDEFMQALVREGIETRPTFYPLHLQPPYAISEGEFPVTQKISRAGLSLPSSNGLQEKEIKTVCEKIKTVIYHHRVIERRTRQSEPKT